MYGIYVNRCISLYKPPWANGLSIELSCLMYGVSDQIIRKVEKFMQNAANFCLRQTNKDTTYMI
jgi:hypothetical protein